MDVVLTFGVILEMVAAIAAFVGLFKGLEYIVGKLNKSHDRNQIIDAHKDDLEALKHDTQEQLQEIKQEQCMLTYCMMATLDGLHQLGCNGKVTQAREDLDKFMNKQAHDVK